MEDINLFVKLERAEFLKLNFLIAYSNPLILFLTLIGLGNCYFLFLYFNSDQIELNSFPFISVLFCFVVLVGFPFLLIYQTNNNINSNKWVSQKLNYTFDKNRIDVNGETFSLIMKWSDVQSIKELKDWFIIYTEKQRGFFLPKNRFKNKLQEDNFRAILQGLEGINISLK